MYSALHNTLLIGTLSPWPVGRCRDTNPGLLKSNIPLTLMSKCRGPQCKNEQGLNSLPPPVAYLQNHSPTPRLPILLLHASSKARTAALALFPPFALHRSVCSLSPLNVETKVCVCCARKRKEVDTQDPNAPELESSGGCLKCMILSINGDRSYGLL